MQKQAKLFNSGNSQAVRLPKEFRIDLDQVYIRREGDTIILTPHPSNWGGFLDGCAPLSDDFPSFPSNAWECIPRSSSF